MTDHPEIEQLSASLDGELTAAETAQLEAHVPTCAECTRTLAALRATLGDLALLAEPQLDGASIAAIDRRIAAERTTRRTFARRYGVVSGAAAAALVALLVFVGVVRDGQDDRPTATSAEADRVVHGGATLNASGADYTPESLATALTAYGSPTAFDLAAGGPATAKSSSGGTGGTKAPLVEGYQSRDDSQLTSQEAQRFAGCKSQIEGANPDMTSVRAESARFKGQPAFVLFYTRPRENPTYAEVWVLRPSDCYTLYFAQSRI